MTIQSLNPPCLEESELVTIRIHPLDSNGRVELRRETFKMKRGDEGPAFGWSLAEKPAGE